MKDKYNHTNFYYIVMALVMCVASGALSFLAAYLQGKQMTFNIACTLLSVLAMAVIMIYLKWIRIKEVHFNYKIANYGRMFGTFVVMYIVAFVFTFLPSEVRPIFVIGTIFALFTNAYEGILFQIYFSVLVTLICGQTLENLIFYIFSGIVGCLLCEYFLNKKTFFYASIIVLTINVSFSEVLYYISAGSITYKNIIGSTLCTLIGLVIICAILPYVVFKVNVDDTKKLNEICDEEYDLMNMFRTSAPELYAHSVRVGNLAEIGAKTVGANPLVAKAGGYYQKIGRLEGKEYIKYGVEIGEAYDFPRSVIDIIKQQNGRKERPKTIEAAIVLMSDTVISAFEIIDDKKNQLNYDRELIVEQVLKNKMERDMFDESGMTIKMYRDLKKCFKQEENIL